MEIYLIVAGIIILTVLLFLTLLTFLYVSGILQSVDVGAGSPPISKATVAYKFAKGSFSNAGGLFNEVTRLAPKSKAIGIYYDNPYLVPSGNLRYAVGAILTEGDVKVEPEVQKAMEAEGFKVIILPQVTNCVRAKFPYINTLSIFIAIRKVYPQMNYYIQEHRLCAYPMVEVYESDYIHFMAPLAKQDEFFVPEVKDSISVEYTDQSVLGEESLLGTPEGTPAFYEDSSYYDNTPGRSVSRDVSEFSHAGGEEVTESLAEDTDLENDETDIQDSKVTSSGDISSSHEVTNSGDALLPDLSLPAGNQSLQDSGICSGHPSVIALDTSVVKENGNGGKSDENDSSSSFEEIHMDEDLNNKPM